MSAMMSWVDWLSLLDLFNTPYPNRPFMDKNQHLFDALAEARAAHKEKRFISLCRHWILYHAGIQDADEGQKIWEQVNQYLDKWYVNKTGPDVYARFRKAIYGNCPHAGESYNNYQPCPPPACLTGKPWSDKVWNAYYAKLRNTDWPFSKRVIACRNKLNDIKANAYTRIAAAERIGVNPCFLNRM